MTPRHLTQTPTNHPDHLHQYDRNNLCRVRACRTPRATQIEWELDFVRRMNDDAPVKRNTRRRRSTRTATHRAIDFGWGAALVFAVLCSAVVFVGALVYTYNSIAWLVTR